MKPDYRKYPYRGIIAEIAREHGKQHSAILMAFRRGNPAIHAIFNKKADERLAILNYVPGTDLRDSSEAQNG
jgi:hypothetical protein